MIGGSACEVHDFGQRASDLYTDRVMKTCRSASTVMGWEPRSDPGLRELNVRQQRYEKCTRCAWVSRCHLFPPIEDGRLGSQPR